jgi:hypothetical protein
MGQKELTEDDLKDIGISVLEVVLAPLIFVMVILLYAITFLMFSLPCFAPKSDWTNARRSK